MQGLLGNVFISWVILGKYHPQEPASEHEVVQICVLKILKYIDMSYL